jgi:hypothetical protein
MDVINANADWIVGDFLPSIADYCELAFVLATVAATVAANDAAWHKENLVYSLFRSLLAVNGAEVILAVCLGNSPLEQLADNTTILTVALVWWLNLFVPGDILNKIMNVAVGDIKPLGLLVTVLAQLRLLVAANAGVALGLKLFPGSVMAVLVGTVAGNGTFAVASIFGDFAKSLSSEAQTKKSFAVALIMTLVGIGVIKLASANLIFTLLLSLLIPNEVMGVLGYEYDFFEPVFGLVKKVIVTNDLIKQKAD